MLLNGVTSAEQFPVVSPRGTDWKLENTSEIYLWHIMIHLNSAFRGSMSQVVKLRLMAL